MAITIGMAGASGQLATLISSKILEASPDAKIRGFCRDPKKAAGFLAESPRVELIQGEAFDVEAVRSFVQGCDVICCGYQGRHDVMIEGQKILVDACEDEKVPRYIASDWCMDYDGLEFGQLFIKEPQKIIHTYCQTKKFVKGVHILNGIFMDTFFSDFFEMFEPPATLHIWGDGNEKWVGTSYENSAEYTAAICLDPNAVGFQRIVGGRATSNEIAQEFEEVYGTPLQVERRGSLDDLYETMWKLKKEYGESDWYKYMAKFYYYYAVNGKTYVDGSTWKDGKIAGTFQPGSNIDNGRYPNVKPVTWKEFMQRTPMEKLAEFYKSPPQRAAAQP